MLSVAEYVKMRFPEQCAGLIAAADEVVQSRFRFTLRWDMERTQIPVVFDGEINWLYQPGDDPEWVFAFNRMKFWVVLGQAYALTGDEKYTEAFVKQLTSWITSVNRSDPENAKAWRSIEAGLRLEYWQKAFTYFAQSPLITDEVRRIYTASVTEQAEFIMGIWNVYNLMSNWGILANHGLFLAGAFLGVKKYTDEALRRLRLELDMQVYRDGWHWEQSPMYHNEVLHCYLDILQYAKVFDIPLEQRFLDKVKAMCMVNVYASKPDHCELSMGDSDDVDQRDILSRAAYLFESPVMKARGYSGPDFDTAWELGAKGIEDYMSLAAETPPETDKAFFDSGNLFFRSSWADDAVFLHFACGTVGAGHGHADKLHIDLFSRGEDILVDAGRYSYVFGQDTRVRFKETRAHNTVDVVGRELYIQKDSWLSERLSRAVNRVFYSDSRYGYAEGGHIGHGFLVNRRIVFIKPDIIVLCDEMYANSKEEYRQYFHFNSIGNTKIKDGKCLYKGKNATAEIVFVTPSSLSLADSVMSRQYNQYEDNKVLINAFTGDGFTSSICVMNLSQNPLSVSKTAVQSSFKGITFPDDTIEALEIAVGGKEYTVVFAHKEYACPTDTFHAGGCVGFGSCVVFDRTVGEREIGTVLLW